MKNEFDCLIIGGGVIGLASALALEPLYNKIGLLDAKPLHRSTLGSEYDARVYAINLASKKLFEQLGVWEKISSRLSAYQKMHVWEGTNAIDFDCRDVAEPCLGFIIEETVIKNALLSKINQSNIHLIDDYHLTALNQTQEKIVLNPGNHEISTRLLLGADGANSWLRSQMNVAVTTWDYQHDAIIAHVETEKAHDKTAMQRFTETGTLAFLPMVNPKHCSIVWSTAPLHAKELMSLNDEQFCHNLSQAFIQRLGRIEAVGKRFSFPLKMRHVKKYAGSNWALLGDAAHTIHPLAGQGVNLGLQDVNTLRDLLRERGLSETTLAAYQRARKSEAWKMIAAMEGFKQLFATQSVPIKALRGAGLTLCNKINPLKRFFIEQAMN